MNDEYCVWPSGECCETKELEQYMHETGLGDDFFRVPGAAGHAPGHQVVGDVYSRVWDDGTSFKCLMSKRVAVWYDSDGSVERTVVPYTGEALLDMVRYGDEYDEDSLRVLRLCRDLHLS